MHTQTTRRGANHGLHVALTLITCGMWLPVWAVVAVIGRRTTVRSVAPIPFCYSCGYVRNPQCPGCWGGRR